MIYREEIMPYKRVLEEDKQSAVKRAKLLSYPFVLLFLSAFFISRVFMLKAMMPFGIAFLVAAYSMLKLEAALFTGAIVIVGYISTFNGYLSGSHAVVAGIMMILMFIYRDKGKNRIFIMSIYSFLVNAGVYIFCHIRYISGGFLLYDFIIAILESTIIMASVYIFTYGMPLYFENSKRKRLSKEEMICLSFTLAIIISGMWDIKYMGLSLRNMAAFFIVLASGYIEGPAMGASWGITLGIVASISDVSMPVALGIFGFSGLMCGIFRNLGKVVTALSFIISCAVMTFYVSGFFSIQAILYDTLLPSLIFVLIPQKRYDKLSFVLDDEKREMEVQRTYVEKVRDLIDKKVTVLSGTLSGLSEILGRNIDNELSQKAEINGMVEKLADRVCANCDSRSLCWKRELYYTYDSFSELLRIIERLGRIGNGELPQSLKNKCIRPTELVKQANNIFEIFRLNNKWKRRLINSRVIVAEQVKGISEIMKSMTAEVATSMDFRSDIEEEIAVALDRKGLDFDDVLAIRNGRGKYEVTIYRKPCQGKQECGKEFATVVSRTLGVRMTRDGNKCKINKECSVCQFRYIEAESYSMITAICKVSKEDVSGDNYSYGNINEGRYLLALSDGMGSGVRASIESNTTISLLEKFIEAGFERNTAIKAINSVLVLRSFDESFATVDMGLVDLHSGVGEFVKIGSAPTFIKSGMEVEVLRSASIPVGILDDIDIESQIIQFKSGDMIVMVTDGVVDSNEELKEKWIMRALKEYDSGNPKDVAEYIMGRAKSYYGEKIGDDMTVIVSKIWKLV